MGEDDLASKAEDSSVLEYVKVAASAIDRARTVIIVMLVASVFVFTQIRNSDGWLDRRIEARIYGLRLLDKDFDETKDVLSKPPGERPAEALRYERARYFIDRSGYKTGDPDDKERLRSELKDMTRARGEQMRLVRLPFFGAVFDADDMGIFAGITFTVVLFWLTLTINRERRNTQIAFRAAETQGSFRLCYNLLAMQQVLTVPPTRANKFWKPFGYISKALYVMPLVIYGFLFHHDWDTRHVGNALGWDKMTTLLWASGAFFVLILILTIICFSTSLKIDKDWIIYTRKVKSLIKTQQQDTTNAQDSPLTVPPDS
ncbi:MAG: hypothetical protein WCF57_07300 [Pyrinomonadaceae bacterium]